METWFFPEGWIDDTDFLAANYEGVPGLLGGISGYDYTGSTIYNSSGELVSTVPGTSFPPIANAVFPGGGLVYDVATNAIYSLSTGAAVWNGPAPNTQVVTGAISGSNVVYPYGDQVFVSPY